MKIVWVSPVVPYPPHSGGAIRIYQLTRLLARRHSVRLLALMDTQRPVSDVEALRKRGLLVETFPAARVPVRWTAAWWRARWRGLRDPVYLYFERSLHARLRDLCAAGDADVVVLETLKMWKYGDALPPGVPVVLSRQNYEPYLSRRLAGIVRSPRDKLTLALGARLGESLERRASARFRYITAVSAIEADVFRRLAPGADVAVVPNGVDLDRFPPSPGRDDGRTIVVAGSMGFFANRDSVLYFHREIWPTVKREHPDARLTVVGSEAFRSLPELLGVEGVELIEPESEIASALESAAVVAVPLRAGAGTRIKVLEALALGKAVVSTSIGCEGLDTVNGRDVLLADTPGDFARLVVQLLRDSDRRYRLGASGRKLVESTYGWERAADIFEAFCGRIVTRDRAVVRA